MDRIGPYQILAELGRGGAGKVYRARGRSGEEVAVKVLLSASEHQRRRFQREVDALIRLEHPNLVAVRDMGEARGRPYVVMDYVEGESLADRLSRSGRLDPDDAVRLARELAGALDYTHRCGLVHRDVKPANVLLGRDGQPRLTDFGLVRDLDPGVSKLSATGVFLGTPAYWPPEQALGELDRVGPRSDVFGLGATLYHMLTGQPPGPRDTREAVVAADEKRAVAPPASLAAAVDPQLDAIVMRCLAHDPAQRFPSAGALAGALSAWERGARSSGSRVAPAAALALVTLGLGVAALLVVQRGPPPRTSSPTLSPEPSPSQAMTTPARAVIDAASLLREAREALLASDEPRAHELAQAVLELEPERAEAWYLLGAARVGQSREEGLASLDRALELDPQLAEAWRLRGGVRADLGRLRGALFDLIRASELVPDDPGLLFDTALVMQKLGRHADALAPLARGLELAPTHTRALWQRSQSYQVLGRFDEARADLERALEIAPGDRDVRFALGSLEQQRGEWERARRHYLELCRRDPTDVESLTNAAVCALSLRDFDVARAELERALALDSTQAVPLHNLGLLHMLQGRHDEALRCLDRAIELDPHVAGVVRARGDLHRVRGDYPAALEDYDWALKLNPEDHHAVRGRCDTRFVLKDYHGALADADVALAREEDVGMLLTRSACLGVLGRTEEALADSLRCVAIDPTKIRGYLNAASGYTGLGQPAKAIEILERALEHAPDDRRVLDRLAQLREGGR